MRPLHQRLALPGPAAEVTRFAIGADLAGVPQKRAPATDLNRFDFGVTATEIIAAIPLEPAPRIGCDDPCPAPPFGKRQPAFHFEVIERRIGDLARARGAKPIRRKFLAAIIAIFSLEYAELERLGGGKMRHKAFGKIPGRPRRDPLAIALLHPVIYNHDIADFVHGVTLS